MKKYFPRFILTGLGMGIGTLVYTRFIGPAHEFDWARAVFVGIFCGIAAYIWSGKKE